MNLINFHKFEKNKRFIAENKCHTVGQGLYKSYSLRLFGNGHNEYIIELLDETTNSKHILYLHENNIYEWRIEDKHEDGDPYDSIEIDAFGVLDNLGYFVVDTNDYEDFDHICVNNRKFKVLDITITNKRDDVKLITNICDDYDHIANWREKYKNIYDSNNKDNYSLDFTNKLGFKAFINNYEQDRTYYFVTEREVFPFKVKTLETKENEYECTLVCLVSWRSWEYETVVELSDYLSDVYDDGYTTAISFKIRIELFDETNEIDDYCYIL